MMVTSLEFMGFEHDIALFALKNIGFTSLDRAIAFLLEKEENGRYEHPFIGMN
jgi:hypothetical protein